MLDIHKRPHAEVAALMLYLFSDILRQVDDHQRFHSVIAEVSVFIAMSSVGAAHGLQEIPFYCITHAFSYSHIQGR
ncbi:hypothetical protein XENTR_v10016930 [Xenopus tropicalis]|nr:hypothetical protein XENTR_v10016930 [Xenopus tropicalis]